MADILIRNMELPKNYPYRLTLYPNGHVKDHTGFSGHGHYQAIELPPHGRLIDAEALSQNTTMIERNIERKGLLYKQYDTVVFVEEIENAPTVLEASND